MTKRQAHLLYIDIIVQSKIYYLSKIMYHDDDGFQLWTSLQNNSLNQKKKNNLLISSCWHNSLLWPLTQNRVVISRRRKLLIVHQYVSVRASEMFISYLMYFNTVHGHTIYYRKNFLGNFYSCYFTLSVFIVLQRLHGISSIIIDFFDDLSQVKVQY